MGNCPACDFECSIIRQNGLKTCKRCGSNWSPELSKKVQENKKLEPAKRVGDEQEKVFLGEKISRKRWGKVPQEIEDKVLKLRKENLTSSQIMKQLNLSRSTYTTLIKRLFDKGLETRRGLRGRPGPTQRIHEEILDLKLKGYTLQQLAEALNVSVSTVVRVTRQIYKTNPSTPRGVKGRPRERFFI